MVLLLRNLFALFLTGSAMCVYAQIDLADSSAQVVSYWDKGEKQTYTVSIEKLKISGADTTFREVTKYDVDVTVLDSAANSYTVQWLYKNFKTDSKVPAVQKIMQATTDMKIIFRTSELGVVTEVLNWKEIQEKMSKALSPLRAQFKGNTEMLAVIMQLEKTFATKEAIESAGIRDIQQFHTFHGAKYILGEVLEGTLQVSNNFGGKPFDADFSVYLDEINETDNNFILRAAQAINKEQLTNATFEFLSQLAKTTNVAPPKRDQLRDLQNETITAARIHGSGWILYSVQTTTVTADKSTNVEERIIELQ